MNRALAFELPLLWAPAWTVHRESNPGREQSFAVIARVGGGIPTVNVDGPSGR